MTDIVQCLREEAKVKRTPLAARCAMLEAAATIENLRNQLKSATWRAEAVRVISTKTEPPIDYLKRGVRNDRHHQ